MAKNSFRDRIGANLRRIREAKPMTQRHLADLIPGWTQSHVSDVEHGRLNVTADSLEKLGVALGCDPAEFIEG